ncbi:pollen receptor-like kinase 4 [Corylus avellana]|uniref:pollen receptor-like kinase 4 n=1 Tax=Corylus avellana TaxID=13451 RepID=UPI00286AC805|nr:pollen receptor-like kinase 4 [Corylus avellana]
MLMGARLARLTRAPSPPPFFAYVGIYIMLSCTAMSSSFSASDAEILTKFKASLAHSKALKNWDPDVIPCEGNRGNWVGVICLNGNVRGLQLENMGLMGTIDVDCLVTLSFLRTLSLMNNTFTGPIPDVKKLSALKSLYLSYNHFSGEIPDAAFEGMRSLKKVFLTNNEFTGRIPLSLASLPRLMLLGLDGNKFDGLIPDFHQKNLKKFNVSNNDLKGPIPASLSKMDSNSFSGNEELCGPPLELCESPPPVVQTSTPPPPPKRKPPALRTAIIAMGVALVIALIAILFFIFYFYFKRQSSSLQRTSTLNEFVASHPEQVAHMSAENRGHTRKAEHGKLSFVRDDRERFDLQELLRGSAEILGSATFGSSYKTRVNGQSIVVKRYKYMNNVEREEFHEHMRRLGRLSHPNLLPLVAYYYRKEEKLLISDFVENGSLASLLHGNHNADHPALDWPTRLRIIKGVARAMAYLYEAIPSLITPHGHLKSSNVLLDQSFQPLLTDYALSPVINLDLAQPNMMAYKSPEFAQHGRITKKTDVWSLGILILEILTGRFPENYLTLVHDNDTDLAGWVNTMIKEKRTSGVFDLDMGGAKNIKSELLKLLKIALSCCEEDVGRRLDIREVVEKLEQLKEGVSDKGEFYTSSVTNDRDVHAFRGV